MNLLRSGKGVYVQYVGPRLGSQTVLRKYKFGNNRHDRFCVVHVDDLPRLMALSSRNYMAVGPEGAKLNADFSATIQKVTGIEELTHEVKGALLQRKYQTIGQVLADDVKAIANCTGLTVYKSKRLQNAIAARFKFPEPHVFKKKREDSTDVTEESGG